MPAEAHRCPSADDAAVRNVIGLTALLGDEGAPEDYRKVYAPSAVWQMGDAVQSGADEIVAAAAARRADGVSGPGSGTRHFVTPLTIEVTGETATAVTYYAFLRGASIAGTGTYRDELARTEAGWRITRRDITPG
jgi:SnoaL-like domain